ncbi:Maleylacetoacetate isomerase [Armadillidium vulgare]|nr:Maleylacetoacetate isomerase [Armadillidium vulgare]
MFYCPYVQRPRTILEAKKIKYESVNIHLFKAKPDWYTKINPLGKVPAIQLNSKVLFESMVICDYLDETYPEPPLYPSNPWEKGWDKCLIEVFEVKVIQVLIKMFFDSPDSKTVKEITETLNNGLDIFEKELAKRGTKFFFGERPGMLDYAIFPWLERIPLLKKFYPDFFVLPKERFLKMVSNSLLNLSENVKV